MSQNILIIFCFIALVFILRKSFYDKPTYTQNKNKFTTNRFTEIVGGIVLFFISIVFIYVFIRAQLFTVPKNFTDIVELLTLLSYPVATLHGSVRLLRTGVGSDKNLNLSQEQLQTKKFKDSRYFGIFVRNWISIVTVLTILSVFLDKK